MGTVLEFPAIRYLAPWTIGRASLPTRRSSTRATVPQADAAARGTD